MNMKPSDKFGKMSKETKASYSMGKKDSKKEYGTESKMPSKAGARLAKLRQMAAK